MTPKKFALLWLGAMAVYFVIIYLLWLWVVTA
jgi:hypothetical protein